MPARTQPAMIPPVAAPLSPLLLSLAVSEEVALAAATDVKVWVTALPPLVLVVVNVEDVELLLVEEELVDELVELTPSRDDKLSSPDEVDVEVEEVEVVFADVEVDEEVVCVDLEEELVDV